MIRFLAWLAGCCAFAGTAAAADTLVAVASNFATTARAVATAYEREHGHSIRITTGATGRLYAQIVNGAPFDALLAADADRPALLEASGHAVGGSRFTYAIGSLVLWSADPAFADTDCRAALAELGDRKLAIANPETAPYGTAARQFLVAEDLWDRVSPHLVYGENIGQTLQFVASGNASLGLIANAQAVDERLPAATCRYPVPPTQHEPLEQQAVLLRHGGDDPAAAGFLAFLGGAEARGIIRAHGYEVPQ